MPNARIGFKLDLTRKRKAELDIEEKKWGFKRQELIYLEAGQHLRSLNGLLWQVPGLAIAITGGLWYATTNLQIVSDLPKIFALIFVGIFNLLTIVVIWRLRRLIDKQINIQKTFANDDAKPSRQYWVIGCWSVQLLCAAIFSFVAAGFPQYLKKIDPIKSESSSDFRRLMDSQNSLQTQVNLLIRDQTARSCCSKKDSASSKAPLKSQHKPKCSDIKLIEDEKK